MQPTVKELENVKFQNGEVKLLDDGEKFISFIIPISDKSHASTVLAGKDNLLKLQALVNKALE